MGSFAVPGALPLGRLHCQFRQRGSAPHSQRTAPSLRSGRLVVSNAKARTPPDTPKDRAEPSVGREWLQTFLSRFGPITEKAQNTTVLDFEKPLVELDNRIKEVHVAILPHLKLNLRAIGRIFPSSAAISADAGTSRLMPCACIQVRKVAEENGVDVSESIRELEERAKQVHTADCTWTWFT